DPRGRRSARGRAVPVGRHRRAARGTGGGPRPHPPSRQRDELMASYVRMKVAAEAYAMPVENVLEAAELGQVRAVPGARPELLGIRSLRGQILPVADLARLLGVHRTAAPSRLLVAEACGFRVGFAIDEVNGIGDLGDLADLGEV